MCAGVSCRDFSRETCWGTWNASKAMTAFDTRLPAAFLFMFCQIIGPQFVSKAFNYTSSQCATKAASCFPHQLCHLLLPDFNIIGEGSVTFPQLLKSQLWRKKEGGKKYLLVLARACAYIHATVDVAAQQKRIVWNVISLSPPSHAAPLPDARVCVREEMRQKSRPLFEQPFQHK